MKYNHRFSLLSQINENVVCFFTVNFMVGHEFSENNEQKVVTIEVTKLIGYRM